MSGKTLENHQKTVWLFEQASPPQAMLALSISDIVGCAPLQTRIISWFLLKQTVSSMQIMGILVNDLVKWLRYF